MILSLLAILFFISGLHVQSISDSVSSKPAKKYLANAPKTQSFGAKAFGSSNKTTLRWLGMAGFFLNGNNFDD